MTRHCIPITGDLAKQLDCSAVILSARTLPEGCAACCIRSGDPGQNRERGSDSRRRQVVILGANEFGHL
jgi:hypothetical protein